jgi:cell filamentation protein
VYSASSDPYCYPGTTILKNRLSLRDQAALEAFEADAVMQRGSEPFPSGRFSISHFRNVHKHLFQDVYPWAGNFRKIRIAKDGSVFCYPEHIIGQSRALFRWLAENCWLGDLSKDEFAQRGAHFLSELNAIHAFREGNGRAQMSFFAMLAFYSGHTLDLDRIEPDSFLAAMIAAFRGDNAELAQQIRNLVGS